LANTVTRDGVINTSIKRHVISQFYGEQVDLDERVIAVDATFGAVRL